MEFEIYIELTFTDVDCFLTHIDLNSTLRVKLLTSQVLSNGWPTNAIHCSEIDALHLLGIARAHCPEAIKRVRQGLSDAGVLAQY